MKYYGVLIVLALLLGAGAQAQDVALCDGAATWFDQAIEPLPGVLLATGFIVIAPGHDPDMTTMRATFAEIAALEYPPCVELARQQLLDGYDKVALGIEGMAAGDNDALAIGKINAGNMLIGFSVGYMTALGWEDATEGE